jgi:hypothetical protein
VKNQKAERSRKRGFTNTLTINDVVDYYEKNKEVPGKTARSSSATNPMFRR